MTRSIVTLLFLLALLPASAQRVAIHQLRNGMTVWLNPDSTESKFIGYVVVKAGARDCPNTGIAHYFEHIMFKGTQQIGTTDYAHEKPLLDEIRVGSTIFSRRPLTPNSAQPYSCKSTSSTNRLPAMPFPTSFQSC